MERPLMTVVLQWGYPCSIGHVCESISWCDCWANEARSDAEIAWSHAPVGCGKHWNAMNVQLHVNQWLGEYAYDNNNFIEDDWRYRKAQGHVQCDALGCEIVASLQ